MFEGFIFITEIFIYYGDDYDYNKQTHDFRVNLRSLRPIKS